MKYRILCCDVLEGEINYILSGTEHSYDIVYTKKAEHEKPDELRAKIQALIDESTGFDAILLGYGLCGNSIAGIKVREIPVIVPRAHDCCTLFLGSRKRFNDIFEGRESMGWGSTGYCRRDGDYLRNSDTGSVLGYDRTYEEYVEEYGKENADFIWETIHPKRQSDEVMFIDIPETHDADVFEGFMQEATGNGQKVIVEKGSIDLLRRFVSGDWNDDFLVVKPGCEITAVYGKEEIISSRG
ncbi:MAG TPA: DUF1638 domain-containing protein [Clostridia bacterium]|nr:DUF1638 domain-containing protein [Clostridia bacterium]HRX41619.1 DUF1638 domain-containing protein [Clostridia bacterium]